jgi:ubiquinone/menaquinone biosynthesis C-methylase UbiE
MQRTVLLLLTGVALLSGCTAFKQCAYESSGRNEWQQPDAVIAALGLAPGARVADIGAGSGYFTRLLAPAVAPGGKVYAVDVDADMNERLRDRLADEGITNVEVVLGEYADPKLPDGGIDLVFTSNTFHHIQDRPDYFRNLKQDLAPGGRVAIVDYDGRKGWFVQWMEHFTPKDEVLEDMEAAGYRVEKEHDFLDRQTFIVFAPE